MDILYPFLILLYTLFYLFPLHKATTPCQNKCGNIPINYPFGSGAGCGHPDFSGFIRCSAVAQLEFSTAAGNYTVSSIDYAAGILIITDPLMSTCSSMQNSGSFILDTAAPFTVAPENIFVLVGCSGTSPVYDRDAGLCDNGSGLKVCQGLYSCRAVSNIGLDPGGPITTCCVYDPEAFGSDRVGFGLELPKLQCSSYSAIYGFGGAEGDPMKWQYGVALQFNQSYAAAGACKNCEDSGGICGFSGSGDDSSFACVCPNGVNTTVNCYERGYGWSGTDRRIKIQTTLIIGGLWMVGFL